MRVLDKGKREAEEKLKEIGELRRQVTMLKTDMVKSEATEKKLKDAIKKKKEELAKEKKLRKQTSSNTLVTTSKTREVNNKLEKDIRSLLGDNTKLKEENKILRNRVSELVSNKDMNPAYYRTGHPTSKLNSSLSVPLSIQNPTFSSNLYESNLKDRNEKRREFLTRKSCDKFPEYRATSYKVLPTLAELTNKDKKRPSSKGSCRSLSKSSFFFGDKKRSDSREKIIGDIETGSCKYCEVCKYRVWRKKLLTYDALDLLNNRDLIKSITCLACDKNYDVKFFINHCKDCRLTNGVPPFRDERGKSIIKTDFFSCDHFDNSVSSSPKNLLDESRYSTNNREIIFTPDEELNFISRAENLKQNESEIVPKLFSPSGIGKLRLNQSATKAFTPRKSSRLSGRKLTETSDSCSKKLFTRKKGDHGSDTEDTLFNPDDFKRPMNAKELIKTMDAFDASENVPTRSRASFCQGKDSL